MTAMKCRINVRNDSDEMLEHTSDQLSAASNPICKIFGKTIVFADIGPLFDPTLSRLISDKCRNDSGEMLEHISDQLSAASNPICKIGGKTIVFAVIGPLFDPTLSRLISDKCRNDSGEMLEHISDQLSAASNPICKIGGKTIVFAAIGPLFEQTLGRLSADIGWRFLLISGRFLIRHSAA